MSIDFSHAPHAWEKEKSNFVALLDLQLESVDHGKAVMRMPFRPEITNGTGAVHGGAIVSLCDTVFYVALASIYGRDQDTTTVALQCNFLAPALPPHDLIAEARVLHGGRRIVYGEVYVRSGDEIVAHATLDFLNSYPTEKPKKSARSGSPARRLRRKRTALSRRTRARSARRMVPFGGFEMPVQYAGILKEHDAVRQPGRALRSLAHGAVRPDRRRVAPWADTLTINAVGTMKPMQARYNIFCNDAGGAHDDTIFYRLDGRWLLVVNASNADKMWAHLECPSRPARAWSSKTATSATRSSRFKGPSRSRCCSRTPTSTSRSMHYYFCAETRRQRRSGDRRAHRLHRRRRL